jgi:hypothetical protein
MEGKDPVVEGAYRLEAGKNWDSKKGSTTEMEVVFFVVEISGCRVLKKGKGRGVVGGRGGI